MISIHAPAKGATVFTSNKKFRWLNFNPRSREGSDDQLDSIKEVMDKISIHAPAKGATRNSSMYYKDNKISIHAPAKGATSSNLWVSS